MKTLHSTAIGKHKVLTDVDQSVRITRFIIDGYSESMELNYEIDLLKGSEVVLTQKLVKSWVISNNYSMMVRDENFQPIADPNNEGEFLKIPAFDYVLNLIMVQNVPLANILTMYISEENLDGRFDGN